MSRMMMPPNLVKKQSDRFSSILNIILTHQPSFTYLETPLTPSSCALLRFLGCSDLSNRLSTRKTVHKLLHHLQLCAVLGGVQNEDVLNHVRTKEGVRCAASPDNDLFRFRVRDDVMDIKFEVLKVGKEIFRGTTKPSQTQGRISFLPSRARKWLQTHAVLSMGG